MGKYVDGLGSPPEKLSAVVLWCGNLKSGRWITLVSGSVFWKELRVAEGAMCTRYDVHKVGGDSL